MPAIIATLSGGIIGLEAAIFSFHPSSMTIRILALASILLTVPVLPAQASTSDWTKTPGGRVRVIIEDNGAGKIGDRELRGALQIELQPGWKTYWRNPGDAGVPPQINIEGEAKAQIAFPAPVRFDGEDEGGIGYKHPVSLPVTFRLTPDDKRLKGHVFLGVCEKICVPVQAAFDFPLDGERSQSPSQATAARTIIETAFDRLPTKASSAFGISEAKREQDKAIFDLTLPDPTAPAELFVASDTIGLSDVVAVDGGESGRRFVAQLRGQATNTVIDYTIVQNGKAVSGQVKLD